ncbi:MAG: hypothetical protein IJV36_07345 [Prevotella sp.]|nr:hypothetical protein [Prevotella sp.]
MKKIVLTLMAMLSMTMASADEKNTTVDNNAQAYDMTVNYSKLAMCLGLDFDQMDAVKFIHDHFCEEMKNAAEAPKEEQGELMNKAVLRDLRYMRNVLDRRQYRKYQQLLNTTLVNRGLIK